MVGLGYRLSLRTTPSSRDLHGRRRIAGARRCDRHRGCDHQAGTAAAIHRGRVRHRGALGHPAGRVDKLRGSASSRWRPIHHHFELLGWSESKVIVRFWIASLVFALFALTTLEVAVWPRERGTIGVKGIDAG